MAKEKIELTLQDESGQEYIAYPFVESEDVTLSNGMDIETMIAQDVSMPIVTHEETSFKAGVGDSDVSNSIVDSSVASMTIKGQTYQNILPEPTLRNAMTDGKTMQKINEGYENVEVVDGVSKSAILRGQTLVNLVTTDTSNGYTLINDGTGIKGNRLDLIDGFDNKNYTFVLEFSDVNIVNENPNWGVYITVLSLEDNGADNLTIKSHVKNGKVTFLYRPSRQRKTINNFSISLHTDSGVGSSITISNVVVLDGDYTNVDIPYFEGMQSVKLPVLTTTGKNLFELPQSDKMLKGSTGKYIKLNLKPNTNYAYNSILDKKGNTSEFDFYGWISNDINSNFTGHEVFHWKLNRTFSKTFNTGNDEWYFHVYGEQKGDDYRNYLINFQLEEGSTATSYEPYKSNILHTPEEVVLRSLPNGVCDTLNLMTGEYVQRIGVLTIDNTNVAKLINFYDHSKVSGASGYSAQYTLNDMALYNDAKLPCDKIICDKLKGLSHSQMDRTTQSGITATEVNSNRLLLIKLPYDFDGSPSLDTFKQYIGKNPITVQYELATPIVKTVDLSTSGNWEKIVLDGSEKWTNCTDLGNGYYRFQRGLGVFNNPYKDVNNMGKGFSDTIRWNAHWTDQSEGFYFDSVLVFRIHGSRLSSFSNEGFEQFLSQNPITVWYQTTTHQDSTNVKEVLSFSNGHIQLSSGVKNSLIPSLSYEVPTSNSYHLDLAKASTQYTMKSSQSTGTFTIDGTQYNVTSNGVFTTPSSMTDKLMIASTSISDMMLLEGDMREKDIPYFEGIKSAFEGQDDIEVVSVGKNLFDVNSIPSSIVGSKVNTTNKDNAITVMSTSDSGACYTTLTNHMKIQLLKGKTYVLSVNYIINNSDANVTLVDIDTGIALKTTSTNITASSLVKHYTVDKDILATIRFYAATGADGKKGGITAYSNIQLEELNHTLYEPYKQNITKIPLLSPLRSLPNGVYDEIILDRENNKAKIIQRVGKAMVVAPQVLEWYMDNNGVTNVSRIRLKIDSLGARKSQKQLINNLVPVTGRGFSFDEETTYMDDAQNYWLWLHVSNNRLPAPTIEGFKSWLSQNPLVTYYELETPVITEVDLEGFPYIYKDGHIFLNTDIAPTSEIKYSINQSHMIEASNEDLMRHEKKITNLHKLIGTYVNVEYESTLLALNLELK